MRGRNGLGQRATAETSDELRTILELLRQLDVRGAIATVDVAGCRKEIASQFVAGVADSALVLMGNQETLHRVVQDQPSSNWNATSRT